MIRGTRTAETVLRAEGPSPRSRNASFACALHLGRRNCAKPLPTRLFVIHWLKKIRFRRSERGELGNCGPSGRVRPRGSRSPSRSVAGTICNRMGSNLVSVARAGVGAWRRVGVRARGRGRDGGLRTASVDGGLPGLTGGPSSAVRGLIQRRIEVSLGKRGGARLPGNADSDLLPIQPWNRNDWVFQLLQMMSASTFHPNVPLCPQANT